MLARIWRKLKNQWRLGLGARRNIKRNVDLAVELAVGKMNNAGERRKEIDPAMQKNRDTGDLERPKSKKPPIVQKKRGQINDHLEVAEERRGPFRRRSKKGPLITPGKEGGGRIDRNGDPRQSADK